MVSENKKREIEADTFDKLNMYKAGFIDGYIKAKKRSVVWKTISKKCQDSWERRFNSVIKK